MVQKYGPRSAWEDPADWVMSSCPWKDKNSVDWSSLLRIRTEDVGCDSPAVSLSALNCAADAHGPLTTDAAESLVRIRYFATPQAVHSIPCSGGIMFSLSVPLSVSCHHRLVRRAGESITHMLLRRHHMTAGGLKLSSFTYASEV